MSENAVAMLKESEKKVPATKSAPNVNGIYDVETNPTNQRGDNKQHFGFGDGSETSVKKVNQALTS